jgi:putative transposase
LLAKAPQKVRRPRQDFHHKTALAIVRANDVIYHENVQVRNLVQDHHLAKSISDAGWSAVLSILSIRSDKAACAGRSVIAMPPACTSQRVQGQAVGLRCRKACPSAGAHVQSAAQACTATTTPL